MDTKRRCFICGGPYYQSECPKNEKTNHTENKEEGSETANQIHVMHGTDYINKEEGEEENNSEYSFYHNTHHQQK